MPIPTPKTKALRLRASLALALLAGLSGAAQAQSLLALYEAARGYDATYLAARSLAESAQYKLAQSDALGLPNVGLVGSATRTQTHTAAGYNLNGNNASLGVQARHPLINRTNGVVQEQARRAYDLSRADLETAEQDLIVRVAQAYFDVLAAQDALATAQTSKKAIAEQLASAKRNFEVGTATITDTREAQARYDLATATEIGADNDLRTRRIALDQLVGQPNVNPAPLKTPVVLPNAALGSAEEWVSLADGTHPSVRKARLAQDIARLEIDKAKSANAPTLDLTGGVTSSYAGGTIVTAAGSKTGTALGANVGLQFNMPLYTGGYNDNRIKETMVLEEKARNDLEAARRGVAQGTRQAYFGVQSLRAQVSALEAAESSSKLALEAAQLAYKVGVRVNLDVLNAQTQLFQTQQSLAKARYDVIVNSLRLRQAAGQLTPLDVQAADSVLAK